MSILNAIFNFRDVLELRQTQLEEEVKIDQILKDAYVSCPNEVSEYMFNMRQFNRRTMKMLSQVSLVSYPAELNKTVQVIDHIQRIILRNPHRVCHNVLPALNEVLLQPAHIDPHILLQEVEVELRP